MGPIGTAGRAGEAGGERSFSPRHFLHWLKTAKLPELAEAEAWLTSNPQNGQKEPTARPAPERWHSWHPTPSTDGTKPTAQLAPNQHDKYQTNGTSSTKPAWQAPN